MTESTTFTATLRAARRSTADPDRGGHLTLERLAELISQRLGTINQPTAQTIGNWERGVSRPSQKDRDILVALVAVLAACGGLNGLADADRLLTIGGYAPLTTNEHVAVFGEPAPLDARRPVRFLGSAPRSSMCSIRRASSTRRAGRSLRTSGRSTTSTAAGGAYIERAEAVTILAATAPAPPPPFTVPYPPNPLFVGRDDELERLYNSLRPDAPVALIPAIAGTGGIGKSQLAVEFAHHYRDRFGGGVFWLTMTDDASVRTQIADYAGPRGLNLPGWQMMGFDDRIAAVRAAWQRDDVRLLIFDNLEDPALLSW